MSIAQAVLKKLRALPPEKQQEVLDFAEFLYQGLHRVDEASTPAQTSAVEEVTEPISIAERLGNQDHISELSSRSHTSQSSLGRKLRELRARIVASGEPFLTAEEIEQEVAEQRDRLKEFES